MGEHFLTLSALKNSNMSLIDKVDLLLSQIDSFMRADDDNDEKEALTRNTAPDQLSDLSTFNIEEDLVQTDDFVAFKGNFGDSDKPSILKMRPSKPKASELKGLMETMQLSSAGKFGKGFGFYKAKCITTKSFKIDVIYPWINPEKEENEEEEKQRLENQQKVFEKFYQRCLPKKKYIFEKHL